VDEARRSDATAFGELERQVERGGLFTHTALSSNAERLREAETMLYGLIDALVAAGVVTADDVAAKAQAVRDELQRSGDTPSAGVALRVDGEPDAEGGDVMVNCAERLHVCKAACCRLRFALSASEVEAGVVKWDLGQPYHIRQDRDGGCAHLNRETRGCGVYANRPGVCRRYSCANDGRIWKDFARMVLNEEWIAANLRPDGPRLERASLTMLPVIPSPALPPTNNDPVRRRTPDG
jgi:Fe-S-cluster containining protein